MKLSEKTALPLFAIVLVLLVVGNTAPARDPLTLPDPVLYFAGAEYFTTGGRNFTRYKYNVDNLADYPQALFAAAPALPPCGNNTNSSRMWVDLFDQNGKRLNGFCALGGPRDLNSIWFALESNVIPPSYIYIEMNDRQTNTKYKSNLADTVM